MLIEKQQYAKLDCKKVNKAKTTTLKLFDDKYEKADTFEKPKFLSNGTSHSKKHIDKSAIGFNYL